VACGVFIKMDGYLYMLGVEDGEYEVYWVPSERMTPAVLQYSEEAERSSLHWMRTPFYSLVYDDWLQHFEAWDGVSGVRRLRCFHFEP